MKNSKYVLRLIPPITSLQIRFCTLIFAVKLFITLIWLFSHKNRNTVYAYCYGLCRGQFLRSTHTASFHHYHHLFNCKSTHSGKNFYTLTFSLPDCSLARRPKCGWYLRTQ